MNALAAVDLLVDNCTEPGNPFSWCAEMARAHAVGSSWVIYEDFQPPAQRRRGPFELGGVFTNDVSPFAAPPAPVVITRRLNPRGVWPARGPYCARCGCALKHRTRFPTKGATEWLCFLCVNKVDE